MALAPTLPGPEDFRRIRLAFLFTQIALTIWLADNLHFRIAEFVMHFFGFMLPGGWYRWLDYIAEFFIHILALISVFMLTRRSQSRWALAGGAIIFNVLLYLNLLFALGGVNAIWLAIAGEKLVVGHPLMTRIQNWSTPWVWLLLIFSGYAIIRDVDARCAKQVFSRAQMRALLFLGLAGWTFCTINDWYVFDILEYLAPYDGNSNDLDAFIWKSTLYRLIVFAPSATFCIAAILMLLRTRSRLKHLAEGSCTKCGYDLRKAASGFCPECGA